LVYEKYIKRGGKIHGPYLYQSKKVNGKVITEYLGLAPKKSRGTLKGTSKKLISKVTKKNSRHRNFSMNSPARRNLSFVLGFFAIVALLFFISSAFTGKVALQIENNYLSGEEITGNLKMSLRAGELIPAFTKVIVNNSGSISEYLLTNLISEELISGSFYAEGSSVSGEGKGYGLVGEKKIYPVLNFELKIKNEKVDGGEEIAELRNEQ